MVRVFLLAMSTLLVFGVGRAAAQSALSAPLNIDAVVAAHPEPRESVSNTRPAVLPAMYAGLATLEGYDAYSTLRALRTGAVEANPLMRGVVKNPTALVAVKGAATLGAIYVAERLWKGRHRKSAIILMVVSNGVLSVIAAHNTSVLRSRR